MSVKKGDFLITLHPWGWGDYISLLSLATGVHSDRRLIQMIHEQHESLWIYTILWIQI